MKDVLNYILLIAALIEMCIDFYYDVFKEDDVMVTKHIAKAILFFVLAKI